MRIAGNLVNQTNLKERHGIGHWKGAVMHIQRLNL